MNLKYIRDQAYHGAATMPEASICVQDKIKRKIPVITISHHHCTSHSLNMVISDACQIDDIRNCARVGCYMFMNTSKEAAA
ncbi:hypothetical protein CEXT_812601 [Caerostris extrusa]|uniref:Uncharacterized protein n=1 Tax=Caerostris extrusa TaxID=172846 RepID=A0AAV4N236_CAEEX|nr:hypothetical protein CEXT_812601 [Caerostris extrusa]